MLSFPWDPASALANVRKHGVDFREAATAFSDPSSLSTPDPDHSRPGDERWLLLGYSPEGRLLVIAHTEQGGEIRLINGVKDSESVNTALGTRPRGDSAHPITRRMRS